MKIHHQHIKRGLRALGYVGVCTLLSAMSADAFAASGTSFGTIASNITGSLANIATLIVSGSYVAGMAMAGAAILKFKAHKDNPTQVPLGTPIALLFVAAALLWLPSIMNAAKDTAGLSADASLTGPKAVKFGS